MFWYSQSYDPGSQPAASVTAVNPNRQKAANFQLHQIKESSMWKRSFLLCFSFLVDFFFFLKPTHLHSCSYYCCYNHVRFASFHRYLLHPCVMLPPLQRDGLGWQESDGRLYVGQFNTNHTFTLCAPSFLGFSHDVLCRWSNTPGLSPDLRPLIRLHETGFSVQTLDYEDETEDLSFQLTVNIPAGLVSVLSPGDNATI